MRLPVICEVQNNHVIGLTICKDEADCVFTFRKICKERTELSEPEIERGYSHECVKFGDDRSICLASAEIPKVGGPT